MHQLIEKILAGRSDANFEFSDLRPVLDTLGFVERIKGSHHVFNRENIDEIINIQPNRSQAKLYQVKQVRNTILKYRLGVGDE
ncbi:MAG: hypothetical protein WBO10_10680 [Pyrinomonadaceae bacterium]